MIGRTGLTTLFAAVLTSAAWLFAGYIVVDTLRAVVPLWSPLPWFDEWANPSLIQAWQAGNMSAAEVLFSQHNEHRILVPRLVFFADDVLFRGGGTLSLACIFAVQALHAGVFAAVLGRARPRTAGRLALAATILAMMFGLRQEENFASGFQLQFVAVFAGATLTFALFGLAVARTRSGAAFALPFCSSLGTSLLTAFTMANGLVAAWTVVVLAAAARLRTRVILICAMWAAAITTVYLWGYEQPSRANIHLSDLPARPLDVLLYVATYLGNLFAEDRIGWPAALGSVGMALTVVAAVRVVRDRDASPGALAMLGVMLFVGASAATTASGRLGLGFEQALSSRYAAGSVAFWAAQLVFWWVYPPGATRRLTPFRLPPAALARGGLAILAVLLCVAVAEQQGAGRTKMIAQSFLQNESANLLMLGLDDPAIVSRTAWNAQDVQGLLPTLKEDGLSIYGTADYAGLGRPATERGPLGPPCIGAVEVAAADPALGRNGVRVWGRALDGRRIVRRVLLADAEGRVVGLASGAVTGAARGAWRGFAVAPPGAALTAYGLLDGRRLCRIGEAAVTPGPDAPASR